VQEMLLLFFFF